MSINRGAVLMGILNMLKAGQATGAIPQSYILGLEGS